MGDYKYNEERVPTPGAGWTAAEREIAVGLRGKMSYKGISKALEEAGYSRTPKAIERFFSRIGVNMQDEDYTVNESRVKGRELPQAHFKPLKTTWGSPMLVNKLELEFGKATSLVPVMIIPDIHAPLHDPKAIEIACKIAELVKPVALVYLGDNVDWVQLSKFDKDPHFVTEAYSEVSAWQSIDREFQSAVGEHCRRYYILGNHELRLRKYIMANPALVGFRGMQFDAILGLDPDFRPLNNLQFIEEEISWRGGKFLFKHGDVVRKWASYTARAEMEKEMTNGISGHTHRAAQYYLTNRGQTKVWTESGHLCTMEPEYMRNPNWQQAVTVGWFNGDGSNDFFHVDLIPIVKHQAICMGHYLSA